MRSPIVIAVALVACSQSRSAEPVAAQLPSETAFVATVSLDRLRLSTAWPKLEAALGRKLPMAGIRSACPSDPVKAIESIAVAMPADVAPDRALLIVRGVDRKVVDACATNFLSVEGKPLSIETQGTLVVYGQELFAHWFDDKTFAIAPGAMTAKDRLSGLPTKGEPLIGDLRGKLRRDRVLSFAFVAPPQSALRAAIAESGMQPEAGYGWLDIDTALRAEVVLRFATADAAAVAAKTPLPGPLAKMTTLARDREVTFSLALDANDTKQLVDALAKEAE